MGKLEQNTINCSEQMCLLFHIHHSAIHSPGRGRKPKLKIVCLDLTHHNRGLLDVFWKQKLLTRCNLIGSFWIFQSQGAQVYINWDMKCRSEVLHWTMSCNVDQDLYQQYSLFSHSHTHTHTHTVLSCPNSVL